MTHKYLKNLCLVLGTILALTILGATLQAQRTNSKRNINDQNIILAAAADLDQCRNGTEAVPFGCDDLDEWVNGNANAEQAHWSEAEFISYRMRFSGLTPGPHVVVIGYDVLKNAKHAIDYLGTYNHTETTADPCVGMGSYGAPTTWPVPEDTVTVTNNINPNTGLPIEQTPGVFTMWGGTITDAQYITYSGGEERQITIRFNATEPDPILAWGGHIAWIGDWGAGNSAVTISGSPFHMRLIGSCPGDPASCTTGGNQDRALQNTAVIPSGVVNIVKRVTTVAPDTGAANSVFMFTATPNFGTISFGLIDDNAGPGRDVMQSVPIQSFGPLNTITVTESSAYGWTLLNVNCAEDKTADSTKDSASPTASIIVQSGETVTCTYDNSQLGITGAEASIAGRVMRNEDFGLYNAIVTVTKLSTGETSYTRTNPFGYYQITGLASGEMYMVAVTVKAMRIRPDSQVILLTSDITNLDFRAATQ